MMNRLIFLLLHIYFRSKYINWNTWLYSSQIRANMPSSVKDGSLQLWYCAQPDHNPPPEPMRETKTKAIGLGT